MVEFSSSVFLSTMLSFCISLLMYHRLLFYSTYTKKIPSLIYYTRANIYNTDSSNFAQLQNIPPSREDSNLWSRDLNGTALYRKPRVPSTILQKINVIIKKIIIAIIVAIIETIMAQAITSTRTIHFSENFIK